MRPLVTGKQLYRSTTAYMTVFRSDHPSEVRTNCYTCLQNSLCIRVFDIHSLILFKPPGRRGASTVF